MVIAHLNVFVTSVSQNNNKISKPSKNEQIPLPKIKFPYVEINIRIAVKDIQKLN